MYIVRERGKEKKQKQNREMISPLDAYNNDPHV